MSASQSTDPWILARESYLSTLTEQQKELFVYASLENVLGTATAENRSYQENSKSVAWMAKLKPFIDAIENYGKALDVYSNTYSPIMCPLWGSIRVLLQMAKQFQSYFERVVDMLATIGDVLPNFRVYEKIFAGHPALVDALSEVYLDVIKFCSKVKDIFSKASTKGLMRKAYMKALWRPFDQQFGEVVQSFQKHTKNVENKALVAHMIEADIARQESQLEKARQLTLQKEMKRQQLLKRLSNIDHQSRHRKLCKLRHKDTGTWILRARQYLEWTSNKSSCCLWCYGIPGSGKTTLVTSVVDKLIAGASFPGAPVVVYFYCDYSDVDSLDISRIVENFILQLVSTKSEIPKELESTLLDAYIGIRKPGFEELLEILSSTIKLFDNIYIILDGIDECTGSNRADLLRVVHSIIAPGSTIVKLLIASRADVDLEKAFNNYLCLEVSGNNVSTDIETFVNSIISKKLESGDLVVRNPALVGEIIKALVNGAQGMFIWVTFQIEDLCEESCDNNIRIALKNLPIGLVETYNRALRKIHIKKPATILFAQKIFKWITCARRPLTIDEIKEAISISPGDKYLDSNKITTDDSKIIRACANLVLFDSDDRTIRFVHYSVKEFLLSTSDHDESISNVHFQLFDAEREVGEICVTYLLFQNFGMEVTRTKTHNLKTPIWGLTILNASVLFGNSYLSWLGSAIIGGLARFRNPKTRSHLNIDWSEYIRKSRSTPPQPEFIQKYRLLNYVIENWAHHTIGFSDTDKLWLKFENLALEKNLSFSFRPWGDVRTVDSFPYMSMCLWAVEEGHEPLLKLLLSPPRGPSLSVYLDQKIEGDLRLSITALHRSAISGYYTCTKLLLDNVRFELVNMNSALDLAVDGRHGPIISLFLDRGAQPYSPNASNTTDALHIAARQGNDIMVQCLLKNGAVIDIADETQQTALHLAASGGHDKVIQCLLKNGAVIDIADETQQTALHLAANGGHDKVVQCLLKNGAVTDIADETQQTALHLAASGGYDKVVRHLLDGGASIDIGDKNGYTALHQAASKGHVKVVRCLLDGGASIDTGDRDGATALHLAARGGNDNMVKFLLDGGAGIDIGDKNGYTPLHRAASKGHVKVVRCLLDGGASIDTGNRDGATALYLAARSGNDNMVKFLLDGGAGIDIGDKNGYTPLHRAASKGHVKVVRCLLDGGASIDTGNRDGATALHLAARGGNDNMVQCLLDGSAGIDIRNKKGDTALHWAASKGHYNTVRYLLDGGAGINITNGGNTALHLAANGGYDKVVRHLLDRGAHKDIGDKNGVTALHLAAVEGHTMVVQHLLERGVGNSDDNAKYTALQIAIQRGHTDLIRLLKSE